MKHPASSPSSNSQTFKVIVGLVMGVSFGAALNAYLSAYASPHLPLWISGFNAITDLFMRLIKMIIAPLVFSTLVVGMAKMGGWEQSGPCRGESHSMVL